MKKTKDPDTWPDRIAIPSLEQSLAVMTFLVDGLCHYPPRQRAAKKRIRRAITQIHGAIAELKQVTP